jgi:hypothetical protein
MDIDMNILVQSQDELRLLSAEEKAQRFRSLQEQMYREVEEADKEHQAFMEELISRREEEEEVQQTDSSDGESSDDDGNEGSLAPKEDDDIDIPNSEYYLENFLYLLIYPHRARQHVDPLCLFDRRKG